MSQLSIMVLAIGISAYDLAISPILSAFLALLFMVQVQLYIASSLNLKIGRKYGGLIEYLPFSYTAILIAHYP